MSKNFLQATLKDLLPPSISGDYQASAMSDAAQPQIDDVTLDISKVSIYENIDLLPEPILKMLAWENGVYGVEWRLAKTITEKRDLVKFSFQLNKRRGTRWAIDRVFSVLGIDAEIVEWWEEGGTPGTFRIKILDVSGAGITEEEIDLLHELIDLYKPLSRHLTAINLVADTTAEIYTAGAVSFVASVTTQQE